MADENAMMQLFGNIAQAIATRPQKSWTRPMEVENMRYNRDRIGRTVQELDDVLKMREDWKYSLANALAALPQQQGPGSWLSAFTRGLGAGYAGPTNARVERAMQKRQAELEDANAILNYDKAMGEVIGYDNLPYGGGKGSGTDEQIKPKVYDFSEAKLPEDQANWGELEIQGYNRVDPQTGVRTPGGAVLNYINEKTNPDGVNAMTANQTAYAKEFTTDRIAEVAKATGGSRGIDTMPEVTLKGGPELAATNMSKDKFVKAVQNQAWDVADQVIKANPKATITREELANALINNFNHRITPKYRVVNLLNGKKESSQNLPAETKTQYDYSKYGF